MPEYGFVTTDVFTNRRFGGNPLVPRPGDYDLLAVSG